jgi:hypothetical protein
MAILAVMAIFLIFFGPTVNVGAGFGLLLLLCPLMMMGMVYSMGNNHDKH